MKYIIKYKFTLLGVALGAVSGFFYWQQIGCASGTCAITSSPYISTLYGGLMGGLFVNAFKRTPKQPVA